MLWPGLARTAGCICHGHWHFPVGANSEARRCAAAGIRAPTNPTRPKQAGAFGSRIGAARPPGPAPGLRSGHLQSLPEPEPPRSANTSSQGRDSDWDGP